MPVYAANDSLTAFGPTAFRLDGTPGHVPELAPLALRAAARAALAWRRRAGTWQGHASQRRLAQEGAGTGKLRAITGATAGSAAAASAAASTRGACSANQSRLGRHCVITAA